MNKYYEKAIRYFHNFHMYPELSNAEFKTTEYIIERLNQLGCFELDMRTKTGVVATYKSQAKKTIAFRADIDALPIQEETGLDYASKNDGVMHACGHDFHTANLLSFADWINDTKPDLNIKLIFQASEEVSPGGSRQIIKNGVLDDVDHVFGLHVDTEYKTGDICIKSGPLFASIDDFNVTVNGSGGHISRPHLAKEPLFCTTAIVSELQNSVARRIDPINPPLIGVGSLIYGNKIHNIISDEAFFCGTIRTHNNETRKKSIEFLDSLVINMCQAYNLSANIVWDLGEPALFNDIELTKSIRDYLYEDKSLNIIDIYEPIFGGEDFSNYAALKPSVFFMLGAHVNSYDFHNSRFVVDLEAFKYGIKLFINITEYFEQKQKDGRK